MRGGAGGGPDRKPPLYLQLLGGYLDHFVPADGTPLSLKGARAVEAMAQFWLCQNGSAAAATLPGTSGNPVATPKV